MLENMTLAVPTMGEGGLESERSGHFGHADCFTLVDIRDGAIADVRTVTNPPHVEGGCLRPVAVLSEHGVDAILAAGMGPRPLAGFAQAGITVYFENETPLVGDAVRVLLEGDVPEMDARHACNHHH